jgi:Pentapeptide repeats (9 copies)
MRFDCNEPIIANSKFCIFHDKDHYSEHIQEAAKRFKEIVSESISQNKPLRCIGYYLPAINFAKLLEGKRFEELVHFDEATFYEGANFFRATFSKESDQEEHQAHFYDATFTERANFSKATFTERAHFSGATFTEGANFSEAKFLAETYFLGNTFGDKTLFNYAIFGEPSKVIFDDSDLSSVSFAGSNGITTIRFGDKIKWRRVKNEVTIIEEKWLKDKVERKKTPGYQYEYQDVSLDLVLTAYRNLRENFEFRLKFDESGKLFIREMELKRNYRHVSSKYELNLISLHRNLKRDKRSPLPNVDELIENGWFRKHLSLTGLYYHLSRYGESISRPTLIAVITLILSTLFWVTQSNPTLEPHFPPTPETNSTSTFVGFDKAGEPVQWLEGFERSLAGFLPFLSAGGETQVGIIDYIIKIFGGGLTFVLLAIALRRKFERKYTR